MSKTYVITGATGNVGKAIAQQLLANGQAVHAIARDAAKLSELEKQGAKTFSGSLTDVEFLVKTFSSADAAFLMIPPNTSAGNLIAESRAVISSYLQAIHQSGIRHLVILSSVGAHVPTQSVIESLREFEAAANSLEGVNVLILRPTYFMENIFWQIPTLNQMGIIGSAIRGDLSIPMVASRDIGQVAAQRLLDLNFSGKSVEYILGQRDVSYNEIAAIVGAAIGKPDLAYVQFPYNEAEQAYSQFLSPDYAKRIVTMAKEMNEGSMLSDCKRTPENTTPTTIEEFAQWFAAAYNAPAAAN